MEKSTPQTKVKKHNVKVKAPKTRQAPAAESVVPAALPPPIDIPNDEDDDNFWDFFDKPFNKPQ